MIVCSINTTTGAVKLTSLMRDIAVDFDDLGKYNDTYRLNSANFFGGPKFAMKTINELLDMNIDSYVMVNFYGFTQMAEALGGIEMDITEDEMNQINKNAVSQAAMAYYHGYDETNIEHTNVLLTEWGENVHLNGRQVLAYARIRKIDSDWGRAERQRKVLSAIMEKLRGKNILELATLAGNLQKHFETNMSLDEMLAIANIVLNSDLAGVQQMHLPQERTYKPGDAQQPVDALRRRLGDEHLPAAQLHLLPIGDSPLPPSPRPLPRAFCLRTFGFYANI